MLSKKPNFNDYYQMWVDRIGKGHNLESRAMHYGYNNDTNNSLSADEAKNATNELVAQHLNLPKKGKVLLGDLGCGVGGTALYMTERFPNSHIFAVNIHLSQLELLRNFPDFPKSRISTVHADFMNLPFEENYLDGAYAIDSSCYAKDKVAFYKEAMQCTKPGGKLVIFDVFYKSEPKSPQERKLLQDSLSGWMVPNWHPASQKDIFKKYSFTNISQNVMPDIKRSYQVALNKIRKTTNPLMIGHFKAIISLYKCLEVGLVQYGLLTATKIN